jgi:hypothetical protein
LPVNSLDPISHLPNDIGQSGTESPASLLVTSAPTSNNKMVDATSNKQKR